MLDWEIRIVTFITNTLVLIGYAMLFTWLQTAKLANPRWKQFRITYLIGITIAFLVLFHCASVLSMIQAGNRIGFGWTYINFQIGTVMFALLKARNWKTFYCLAVLLLAWFWWLPDTPQWLPLYLLSLVLMVVAKYYGATILKQLRYYFPFSVLFALPIFIMNDISLSGINVGWPWQVGTSLFISGLLWLVQYLENRYRHAQAKLRQEARRDELTGLYNFRVFSEDLQTAYEKSLADPQDGYAVYTLDIDHFKQINDQYGHLMGNRVLEQVATQLDVIMNSLCMKAKIYRTGGEEFSLIVSDVRPNVEQSIRIAKQIHDDLGKLTFTTTQRENFQITISLGQDCAQPEDKNYLEVYNRADKYLYAAKQYRNTVTVRGLTLNPQLK